MGATESRIYDEKTPQKRGQCFPWNTYNYTENNKKIRKFTVFSMNNSSHYDKIILTNYAYS